MTVGTKKMKTKTWTARIGKTRRTMETFIATT